jgi:hypothetical protein
LQLKGFRVPDDLKPKVSFRDSLGGLSDAWENWPVFLQSAASLAFPRQLEGYKAWRYPALSRLEQALLAREAGVIGFKIALTEESDLLRVCMLAAAHAAGLDLPSIAGEAALAQEEWKSGRRDVVDVMFAAPPPAEITLDPSDLDEGDKFALVKSLEARSDWLPEVAVSLLHDLHDPVLGQDVAQRIPLMRPERRTSAAIVAITNSPHPLQAACAFLDSDDPFVRPAVAAVAYRLREGVDSAAWAAIHARALADPDLTVRAAAGADDATRNSGAFWSCGECGNANDIKAGRCAECGVTMHYQIPGGA